MNWSIILTFQILTIKLLLSTKNHKMRFITLNFTTLTHKSLFRRSTNLKMINLEFVGKDIDKKKTLINRILEKHNFMKTYENELPSFKSNDLSLQKIIQISGVHKCDSFSEIKDKLKTIGVKMVESPSIKVPWFPTKLSDINLIGKTLFKDEILFNQDHPNYTDPVYRKRRDQIHQIADNYKIQNQIPDVNYTQQEHTLWSQILKTLKPLHQQYFCSRYLQRYEEMNRIFNIQIRIPQLSQLSAYLNQRTGFRIKPVHGIVSQREFLNALAFKVFLSTQYLRHPAVPDYTPEPDIVHQIIGHVPMFADKQIAVSFKITQVISQKIGQISLGASDEEIKRLGSIYFFTIEFGICKQNGENKIFGAGFASCVKEILVVFYQQKNYSSDKAVFKNFEPEKDCYLTAKTLDLQDIYCITESLEKGLEQITEYGKNVKKEIKTVYDRQTEQIKCDKRIERFRHENCE